MKNQHLSLFGTDHCHLCKQAEQMLKNLNINSVTLVEITEDLQLLALYELLIPVLQRDDTKAELNWPFDKNDVISFVQD